MKETKRMKQEEVDQLFELLYKLDDHCETFLANKDNELVAMKCINELQINSFFHS